MKDNTIRPHEQPLESWKEIAAYLKRDVRTVIRWEKSESLPVHRQMHQARGSVFAYPSELEAWKGSRELRFDAAPLVTPWRRAVSAVGFAMAMLLALGTMASGPIHTPTRAAANNMNAPKFKKIRIPTKLSMLGLGALSPDGGRFAFASEGSIWVVPVHGKVDPDISGEPLKLTESIPDWVVLPTWSGDGKWIAFNHIDEDHASIYVVPSGGGQTKQIAVKAYRSAYRYDGRLSLSPDGKLLAFASTQEQEKGKREALRIYTVPVEGGAATPLTDSWTREPEFSPDGNKIAYVKVRELKPYEERSDVWVMPVQGGGSSPGRRCAESRNRSRVVTRRQDDCLPHQTQPKQREQRALDRARIGARQACGRADQNWPSERDT